MRNTTFLLFLAFIVSSNEGFSHLKLNKITNPGKPTLNQVIQNSQKIVERGLEIRYYVFNKKTGTIPSEITIDKVKYTLFKSKEEAIQSVKYSTPKKDYTIVYVVSEKIQSAEIIAITD